MSAQSKVVTQKQKSLLQLKQQLLKAIDSLKKENVISMSQYLTKKSELKNFLTHL